MVKVNKANGAAISATKVPATHVALTAPVVPAPATQSAIAVARANVVAKVANGIGVTQHTNATPIAGCQIKPCVAAPTAAQLAIHVIVKPHHGVGNGIKRWHNYQSGTTPLLANLLGNQCAADLSGWYVPCGYMATVPPTAAMVAAAKAAWQQGQAALVAHLQAAIPANLAYAKGILASQANAPAKA